MTKQLLYFKPLNLVKVTEPRVGTAQASSKTVRNRTNEIQSWRSRVSRGEETHQLMDEMRALQQDEREELLSVFTTPTSLSAENMLALKADLMIPWNKLRAMRRCASYTHMYIHVQ